MKQIAGKIGVSMVTIWIIVTLTFFLMKMLPGDPFSQEQALPGPIHKALRTHYGLDDPLWKQYVSYLTSVGKGDLGPSFKYRDRTVNSIIRDGAPVSLRLGFQALLLALSVGVPLGLFAALYHNRIQDKCAMIIATLGISIPSFLLATLLQWGFAVKYPLFPVARWGSFQATILPTIALAALPIAFLARLVRASLLEVLRQDYIDLALSKGLSYKRVVLYHGVVNALMPLLPYFGQMGAGILTGSFIIEKIFAIPGLGQAFVTSVSNRDYTVIMGLTIFYSVILMISVVFTDLLYAWLDPRTLKKGRA